MKGSLYIVCGARDKDLFPATVLKHPSLFIFRVIQTISITRFNNSGTPDLLRTKQFDRLNL